MADKDKIQIKKGNGKEIAVTEKAYRVIFQDQGYKKVEKKKKKDDSK
ncbi:hypothetical protein [Halobacillus karajensis]|uniref:Uncharacterized protein n=1 Tax=Halobacillus karajensis TaxID=195088 RepID=A0A059NXR3_9BACI|nr:hypothetical protein [Halobacillus karajensis]CDQ22576.1 hypothetical protein BN983_00789 [Halobacillus karajensis]CDQ26058.1 hypothetical protein BN981_00269 [Halobacillus karajensis]